MLATLFLLLASGLLLLERGVWWIPALAGAVLSQGLILTRWRDARYGTILNALVLAGASAGAAMWHFQGTYNDAVHHSRKGIGTDPARRITEADLEHLPPPVQRYLRASGAVGSTRPRCMRMHFQGSIRALDGPWMPFTSVQENTFERPTRLFWMDANMKGLPVQGFHAYADGKASMLIKALGLITVQDVQGPELDTAETVTYLNDLCLFAPAALIDERITWVPLDDHSAQVTFNNDGLVVTARLHFNAQDLLSDFESDDRYYLAPDGALLHRHFRTPVKHHGRIGGGLHPEEAEAVWTLGDTSFVYGRFTLRSITYDSDEDGE